MGFATGDCTISLNGFWFERPRRVFIEQVLSARAATPEEFPLWHGGVGGVDREFERLLTHEFGHLVAAVTQGSRDFAARSFDAAVDDPSLAVSGYALVDPDEHWAELFAALIIGGSDSPQVGEMREFLGA